MKLARAVLLLATTVLMEVAGARSTWLAEYSLYRTDKRMFEFACHEGNDSLPGSCKVRGERAKRERAKREREGIGSLAAHCGAASCKGDAVGASGARPLTARYGRCLSPRERLLTGGLRALPLPRERH